MELCERKGRMYSRKKMKVVERRIKAKIEEKNAPC